MAKTLTQHLNDWTEAPSLRVALRRIAEYLALRLWIIVISCFPIEMNLRTARLMGRIWWLVLKRHRERAMDNLRPALGDRYDDRQLRRIARQSCEHFAQLYLVELVLTPRIITEWSWARHVELDRLGPVLRELLADRGVIMLTGHFGNYELLGYTICRLGIPLTAIMRPLDNPLINRYLVASREAGGLSLLYKKGVTAAAPEVLDRGGALCFIADQDAGRKGLFVDFFGRKASTYKSIGLLAMQKRVPIVVGYAARVRPGFHYRLAVERIIQPEEWDCRDDPLYWITQTFSQALEAAIRRWPEQYLWVHRRWKHRPKSERPLH
ncbi:MAG: lysophospholipid acyltransferase family protein [Phycisphaerae bacterium]|nr:lysophospholipid acyltransferase family protein [Phycisphaerae bacterium]